MNGSGFTATRAAATVESAPSTASRSSAHTFEQEFTMLFESGFPRLFRYLDRLSGDPELAADLAQEAFVRLYRRQVFPDSPLAWLVSVALNLFRNARTTAHRRRRLLTLARAEHAHSDAGAPTDHALFAHDERRAVRSVLDRMEERERRLLLLSAEGFSYHDMALALGLHEASVGTLLARARVAFKTLYRSTPDAP